MLIPREIIAHACPCPLEPEESYMDHPINQLPQSISKRSTASTPRSVDKEALVPSTDHPILSRLIEEVRNERRVESGYDRVHNRHNRGR